MPMNAALPKTRSTPAVATRKRTHFGVSISPVAAIQIDKRVTDISQKFGVEMTRSRYFELLAGHDQNNKVIEQIFATGR